MDMDTGTRATKETILETIRATTKETIKETTKETIKETIKDIKATKATRATTTIATTITTSRDHLTNTLSLAIILDLDPLARSTMAVAAVLFAVEDSEVSSREVIYHGRVYHMEHLLAYDVVGTNLLLSI